MLSTSRVTRILAITLMLWCAGAGCMMVSYARGGDTEAAVSESASSAAQDMAGMPACHARQKKNRKLATSKTLATRSVNQLKLPMPTRSGAMSCCPLTTGSIAVASRAQSNHTAAAISNTDSQIPNLERLTNKPLAVPLRLPNRARSYLLDCAFLI